MPQRRTNLAIYFVPYTGTSFQFDPPADRLSLKARKLTYDGDGGITSVVTGTTDYSEVNGLIVVYGRDETVGSLPARVYQTKYPFAALLETGKGVDYVSAANNAGCEKCHTTPYLKHGYIYGEVGRRSQRLTFTPARPATWTTAKAAISNGSSWSMIRRWLPSSSQTRSS